MMADRVELGQHVLVLWSEASESLQDLVNELKEKVGAGGRVQPENVDRLALGQHASTFDIVLCGFVNPGTHVYSQDTLAEVVKSLKPGGTVFIQEAIASSGDGTSLRTDAKLQSTLKLSGFISVSQVCDVAVSDDVKQKMKELHKGVDARIVEVTACKPNYEVGASSQLSFALKKPKAVATDTAKVWALSANDMMDDDVDIIDSDELLDEEDLQKPDPSTLRVCGTTGKRKACKDCSCGLAEELAVENGAPIKPKSQNAASACGSCYLGDAFRCASCPYLGMPAFKPGEKVVIPENRLNPDQ